ncbi:NUDIX domain-containing protein [Frankia sp. Cr1]|uniref:NUDIX domain-containing protein n=1 Tax=Frankia sp. Cr1 TaxID=3073931 RepID=UPI002AD3F639|nr:NUDIX domain-containing protein [Frankia sp. Cr1]
MTIVTAPQSPPGNVEVPRFQVDVHVMARWDRQILFTRQTAHGCWVLPTSPLQASESATAAVYRIASEQVVVVADPAFTWLAGVQHDHDPAGNRVGLYFEVRRFRGLPVIADRRLYDHLGWFSLDHLPEPMPASLGTALAAYQTPEYYTESGWSR